MYMIGSDRIRGLDRSQFHRPARTSDSCVPTWVTGLSLSKKLQTG
jgi:hypothetical protein